MCGTVTQVAQSRGKEGWKGGIAIKPWRSCLPFRSHPAKSSCHLRKAYTRPAPPTGEDPPTTSGSSLAVTSIGSWQIGNSPSNLRQDKSVAASVRSTPAPFELLVARSPRGTLALPLCVLACLACLTVMYVHTYIHTPFFSPPSPHPTAIPIIDPDYRCPSCPSICPTIFRPVLTGM